jgi:RNA polymerase sigma factor (sigma-70 family)
MRIMTSVLVGIALGLVFSAGAAFAAAQQANSAAASPPSTLSTLDQSPPNPSGPGDDQTPPSPDRARLQRILGPHPGIADLLQEVYLHLLLAGENNALKIESFNSYVMTVARNKAIDWLRHARLVTVLTPTADIDLAELAAEGDQPDDLLHAEQELALFFNAVSTLPDRCREVFVLRKVYGMSQKQIARLLGSNVNMIATRAPGRPDRCRLPAALRSNVYVSLSTVTEPCASWLEAAQGGLKGTVFRK